MKRSNSGWYEFTWNPVAGCKETCRYCFARGNHARFTGNVRLNLMSDQCGRQGDNFVLENEFISETGGKLIYPFGFEPTLHKYRFTIGNVPNILQKGHRIMVCETGELFGEWVPDEWIVNIFEECLKYDRHEYIFTTRYPERYRQLLDNKLLPIQDNFWYGTSVVNGGSTLPEYIHEDVNCFLCIEPLQEQVELPDGLKSFIKWVVIGAETGERYGKVIPEKSWIDSIVAWAQSAGIPVFMRNTLESIMGSDFLQEYPPGYRREVRGKKTKERVETTCGVCGKPGDKKSMIGICAIVSRKQSKVLRHVCRNCFPEVCKYIDSPVPEMVEVNNG